jgi:hypothetical protein
VDSGAPALSELPYDLSTIVKIDEIFKSIGNRLVSDFESISGSIHHNPSKGRAREQAIVKEYLSIYLPKRLGTSNGEIVCTTGEVSPECDCVIFDALTCPFLVDTQDFRIFPIEAVFGVIEIKSFLGERELSGSIENLAKIKGFPKAAYAPAKSVLQKSIQVYDAQWTYFPTFGAIFAYDSKDLRELAESANSLCENLAPHQRIDHICVLKKGCIVNRVLADGRIDILPSSKTKYQAVSTENSLMLTTIFLQEVLSLAWSYPIQLREYLPEASYGHFI